jgi:hypothetical protein
MAANDKQISGTHYKQTAIQPWDYVAANNLGYFEGSAIKYITRWRSKGGIADIQKAIHFLEKLIELESPTGDVVAGGSIYRPEAISQRASMGFPNTSKVAEYARYSYQPPSEFWDELNKVTEQWVMGKQERDTFHGG